MERRGMKSVVFSLIIIILLCYSYVLFFFFVTGPGHNIILNDMVFKMLDGVIFFYSSCLTIISAICLLVCIKKLSKKKVILKIVTNVILWSTVVMFGIKLFFSLLASGLLQ